MAALRAGLPEYMSFVRHCGLDRCDMDLRVARKLCTCIPNILSVPSGLTDRQTDRHSALHNVASCEKDRIINA